MTQRPDTPRWRERLDAGQAALAAGRSREAAPALEAALALKPDLAEAWRLLAQIRTAAGDMVGARGAELRAVAGVARGLHPAVDALIAGDIGEADGHIRRFHARSENEGAAARLLAAEIALRRGDAPAAASLLRPLGSAPDALRVHARLLLSARRLEEAAAALFALLAQAPDDFAALAARAAVLTDLRRHEAATQANAAVVRAFPDQPYAHLVLARSLRALGRTAEAISEWRAALELDPACAEAWLGLADLKTYRFSAADTAALHSLTSDGPADARAKLGFALGAAFEQEGMNDEAFAAYEAANALEAALRRYDPNATTAFAARSRAAFTAEFFQRRAGWGVRDSAPIFVVGLPRSGSTLVEQILASHPEVEGAGELPDLPFLAAAVRGYPEGLSALSPAECTALGAEYLRRARQTLSLGRPRFIDKTPKNFLHAGFIRLVLPGAKIIDVRRHPLDTGVSIFRQHFGVGFSCAFDLEHIGRYWRDYAALMTHWDEAAPDLTHRLEYERFIADPEPEIRRLLEFLNLPFDAACLRFFDNPRAVDTPSSEQVRQPIFATAVGRWRRFEPWLGPLRDALGGWADSYPAPPAA